jgi:hypothetical protein
VSLAGARAFVTRTVYAYFGHHKGASTWIWEILDRVSRELGHTHYLVIDDMTPQGHGPLGVTRPGHAPGVEGKFDRAELGERMRGVGAGFVSCVTADREQLDALSPVRGFHVIRDPRDVVVSAYFSHRNSHPTDGLPHLAEHRERLRGVSKEEGLLLEMDFSGGAIRDMAEWDYARPEIIEIRMEELTTRPYDLWLAIFEHLGLLRDDEPTQALDLLGVWFGRTRNRLSTRGLGFLRRPMPATGQLLLGSIYAHRFEAKTRGRRAGSEDAASHYRKGVAGDWVNHFDEVHVRAFKDRFEGLVPKLGYEPDDDWAANPAALHS